MLKKNLQVLAALLAFSSTGLVQADVYDYNPGAFVPVADARSHESEPAGEPMSCKEARDTAWFLNELQRSDGSNGVTVYVPCQPELLASTADAD